jgi:glucose/arabinose dehydrogenase
MKSSTILLIFLLSLSLLGLQSEPFAFKAVATGLMNPWEVAWGPDDSLWVTERTGKRITRVNPADGSKS